VTRGNIVSGDASDRALRGHEVARALLGNAVTPGGWRARGVLRLRTVLLALAIVAASSEAGSQGPAAMTNPPDGSWPQHGRTPEAQRFSPLSQIDRDNIDALRLAWSRDLGFVGRVQGAPAVWEGVMYLSTPTGVLALDAVSGDQLWEFDATTEGHPVAAGSLRAPRGTPVVHDGVVFITLRQPVVVAVDAATGEEVWRTDVGIAELAEGFTTNPIFADGRVVAGVTGADFGGAPGRILALDAGDGEILWTFHVVPLDASDPAHATWDPVPPSWQAGVGGASAWNAGAYDSVSGTIIYGTGQPVPSDRLDRRRRNDGPPSPDLYSSSFVALDAETGALRWYHQPVPADEWEYDQHTVPIIADLELHGETRRTAVLATTTGFLVLIDIETGDFRGAHQLVDESTVHTGYQPDGTPIIDDSMRYVDEGDIRRVCPGARWAHIAPGAYSPETGLLYRPNETACLRRGAQSMPDDWQPGMRAFWLDAEPRRPEDFYERWGALSAIDPVTGAVAWEFALPYPHDAGPLVTAGGVVFSAFSDRVFRAFDAASGDVLWQQVLTSHSEGGTITYQVEGRQYVAVLVGHDTGVAGIPALDLPRTVAGGPSVFVFALP
jgi:PQQ-dependent dehydrogenase (methanol/ethanol family)